MITAINIELAMRPSAGANGCPAGRGNPLRPTGKVNRLIDLEMINSERQHRRRHQGSDPNRIRTLPTRFLRHRSIGAAATSSIQ